MAKSDWLRDTADELWAELLDIAETVARDLEPPPDAYDGQPVSRAEYIENAREMSVADPMYMQRDLDAMAPPAIQLPDGTMGRAPTGVRNYLAKWREARPDIWLAVQPEPAIEIGGY